MPKIPRVQETRVASHLGPRRLAQIEALTQMAQGKGYGSSVGQETAAVRELLGGAAERALVVLDVGANVGEWTLHALNALPNAAIHCFEPSSAAFAELSTRVGQHPRVSVHRLALSNADGEALLYTNAPGSKLGSLTKRRLVGLDFSFQEPVTTRTLESWSRSDGVSVVDVLKLDVEGHEMDALRGAGGLLDTVRVIQFEFGGCNIDTRTYFRDFWYFFTETGRRIYRLGPAGLRSLDQYTERDETFVTTNYFVTRRS